MLTITLQGKEADDYFNYLNSLRTTTTVNTTIEDSKVVIDDAHEKKARTSLDISWHQIIDAKKLPVVGVSKRRKWTNAEKQTLINAVNRKDKRYYRISVLAKYLGRTARAIASEASRQGYRVHKDMLISI